MGGGGHQVSPGRAGNKGLAEVNYDLQKEHKEVREGIVGEGQGLSEEDESKINESAIVTTHGSGTAAASLGHQASARQQQPVPAGPVVRWERILPFRTLNVLLVENDDSTRQVVSALLRNCSYEVTAAANGLQAWKILGNPTNHIDIILTEVAMPGLTGIGLLWKIMSHEACKHIPVIMMSSNDAMGTVFKCLSKGAVDFLVKPIRKNELKNLWQHVWRRSHSSSGSASESGIQTQKSVKSKSGDDSDNNTSSNDEDENGSIGLNARDGSDNGSGTQSGWTKHAVEVDSPQPMSPSDQVADPRDSTCAQVISESELFCKKWLPMATNRECPEQKEPADEFMGKDLKIGVPRNLDTQCEPYPTQKVSTKLTSMSTDKVPESNQKNMDALGLESSKASNEPSTKAADLIGGIDNNSDALPAKSVAAVPNGFSRVSESKDKENDASVEPSLQLSLKRLRSTGEVGIATQDDRNVLRRSDQSAFSRYRNSAASTQAPTGYGGSCSPLNNSSEAVKTESVDNVISNSNPAFLKQGSNGSSNNNDMGSTTKNVFADPPSCKEKAASTLAIKCIHPSSAFHPVQISNQQVMQEKADDVAASPMVGQPRGVQHQFQVQHHHQHHHHHHHHHVHSMRQKQPPPEHDDLSHKNTAASAQHCGSSNMFAGPIEGNAANYSINGSNSSSNHGSNGQKGCSAAVNTERMHLESSNGVAEKCGVGSGNGSASGSGSGVDQNRFAQREAALNKFRQKRKERNFGKKVRYQSRKRLAEQRPRVRGQFVRQTIQEHNSREEES